MKVSVVVGRFQIDKLHQGHEDLLKMVHDRGGVLCVILGGNENKGSKRNPLDFVTRKVMVETWYRDTYGSEEFNTNPPVILHMQDCANDDIWSINLDKLLRQTFPGASFCLYGGRDSFLPYYQGKLPQLNLEGKLHDHKELSATDVRNSIGERPRITEDFRRGIIFSTQNQWSKPTMCVDVAAIEGDKILLGRKKDETTWRFFGGFVSTDDRELETAALRELQEEADIRVSARELEYVCSAVVEDYRYKGDDDGTIMTVFFQVRNKANLSTAAAGDDIVEVRLFPFDKTLFDIMNPSHLDLAVTLLHKNGIK